MLLSGARVVMPDGVVDEGWVRVERDRITATGVGACVGLAPGEQRIDLPGRTVLPGFVDLHVHGGGGGSFTSGELEEVALARAFHLRSGTTRSLASLVTAPIGDLLAAVDSLADLAADGVVAGIHLEGPFLARSHCGAQDPRHLLEPDPAVLAKLLDAGRGHVRMVTVAPERPGALELVRQLVASNVIAALGHSNATYSAAAKAIDLGARVVTHLGNGMRAVHQREPGIAVAGLECSDVVCELIADGYHLHPAMLRLAFASATGRVALVTDAISAAGAPDGRYRLGPLWVEVRDREAHLEGTTTIAGSTTTMAGAVRYSVCTAGLPLLEVSRAASATPAALLGLDREVGSVAPGMVADLVVLDDRLVVEAIVHDGRWLEVTAPRRS